MKPNATYLLFVELIFPVGETNCFEKVMKKNPSNYHKKYRGVFDILPRVRDVIRVTKGLKIRLKRKEGKYV